VPTHSTAVRLPADGKLAAQNPLRDHPVFGARRGGPLRGHEDPFAPPRLSARYVVRQETFAGTRGNGREAPKADGARCHDLATYLRPRLT
jgi:hypothetical protein